MLLNQRFLALKTIYDFYDNYICGFETACQAGCDVCCTNSVVATGLEIDYLISSFPDKNPSSFLEFISNHLNNDIYRPGHTTNQIASFCLNQTAWDDNSTGVYGDGACPFLAEDGLCNVYDHRPFACRAMSSKLKCKKGNEACMEPFLITVNLSLFQIIEHLDKKGFSGNMLDLIDVRSESQNKNKFLIKNLPFPGFIIPDEEKKRFDRFYKRFIRFKTSETCIKDVLNAFKLNCSAENFASAHEKK